MSTTTVYFDNPRTRYCRGPWLAITRSTSDGSYRLQWYWTDGHGSARYNPALPGLVFIRRKRAEAAKREIVARGEPVQWIDWPAHSQGKGNDESG